MTSAPPPTYTHFRFPLDQTASQYGSQLGGGDDSFCLLGVTPAPCGEVSRKDATVCRQFVDKYAVKFTDEFLRKDMVCCFCFVCGL
jgi:hypothetical protein